MLCLHRWTNQSTVCCRVQLKLYGTMITFGVCKNKFTAIKSTVISFKYRLSIKIMLQYTLCGPAINGAIIYKDLTNTTNFSFVYFSDKVHFIFSYTLIYIKTNDKFAFATFFISNLFQKHKISSFFIFYFYYKKFELHYWVDKHINVKGMLLLVDDSHQCMYKTLKN